MSASIPTDSDTETIDLAVEGMTCTHCVSAVGKAIRAVFGVKDVAVSLETKSARVTGKPDRAAILAAIAKAGYRARTVPE